MRQIVRGMSALVIVATLTWLVGFHGPGRPEITTASAWPQRPAQPAGSLLFVSPQAAPSGRIKRLAMQTARTAALPKIADVETDTLAVQGEIVGLYGSPNGRWIAVETALDVTGDVLVQEVATGKLHPAVAAGGGTVRFLDWAPGDSSPGDHLLVRIDPVGANRIGLVSAIDGRLELLDTPPYTYDATLSPDGRQVLCATNRGLGFGSEVWLMDRAGGNRTQLWAEPKHIIAYPRWSPTGNDLAYIRLADNETPFTLGELCFADRQGQNRRSVAANADAGHGYRPAWSPDGTRLAFVVRDNAGERVADADPTALESNIYLAVPAGRVEAFTRFDGALTAEPVWSSGDESPGRYLAFSTTAGGTADIWQGDVTTREVWPLTQGLNARHPVWLPQ